MYYGIFGDFEAHPGKEAELEAALREAARTSLEEEPGCLRFEILLPVTEDGQTIPGRVMASEIFDGWESVVAHRESPRTPARVAHIRSLVKSRRIVHAQLSETSAG